MVPGYVAARRLGSFIPHSYKNMKFIGAYRVKANISMQTAECWHPRGDDYHIYMRMNTPKRDENLSTTFEYYKIILEFKLGVI